ncbi:MAG: hypothetical protein IT391_00870 [Nitrospira sp.]|nr:hypothetical protein [Nitrospira sp.]
MIASRHMTAGLMGALLCMAGMAPAMALEAGEDFAQRPPVSEAVLDQMRGGFQSSPNSPVLAFGIERNVLVNGKLVSSTVLTIPSLSQLAGNTSDAFKLIQTGGGNAVLPGMSSLSPFMTVMQNSLDNQTIQQQTVMNATVAALGWARSLALGNALTQATMGTIRH